MMTSERRPDEPAPESRADSGVLAEWFADGDASDEVQALRAWVAGLSSELAEARRARDEALAALSVASAEIGELRGRLAQLTSAPLAAAIPLILGADLSPPGDQQTATGPGEPNSLPAMAAVNAAKCQAAWEADGEITAEMVEAWASTPLLSPTALAASAVPSGREPADGPLPGAGLATIPMPDAGSTVVAGGVAADSPGPPSASGARIIAPPDAAVPASPEHPPMAAGQDAVALPRAARAGRRLRVLAIVALGLALVTVAAISAAARLTS